VSAMARRGEAATDAPAPVIKLRLLNMKTSSDVARRTRFWKGRRPPLRTCEHYSAKSADRNDDKANRPARFVNPARSPAPD
jgi:hypothetical protein